MFDVWRIHPEFEYQVEKYGDQMVEGEVEESQRRFSKRDAVESLAVKSHLATSEERILGLNLLSANEREWN